MSPITEFYANKSVLVTGATGYMGKVLLEKLIRSLPELSNVYILIRPKKGLTADERVKKLTESLIFTYNSISQQSLNKIKPISGDITKDGLDLSEPDRQLLIDEVSVVFHLAASIKMDLSLKEAVSINTKSTLRLFKFCMNFRKLSALVHLSTAYCNVEITPMEEKVYPSNVDPYKVIEMVEWIDEKSLNSMENSIIHPHPNTYTFTKRLSELIAKDMGQDLPLVIVRPSIVIPALKEPTPGWVDNFYGPLGLTIAGGAGILRTALVDLNLEPQTIPVDVAINGLIIMGYQRATSTYNETPIFNVTQGEKYLMSWGEVTTSLFDLVHEYPFQKTLWYPRDGATKSVFVNTIFTVLFHFIPALVIDFLLILFLRKPFLLSLQKKIFMASKLLHHFAVRKWEFSTVETNKVMEKLDSRDTEVFYTLSNDLDVKKYLSDVFFFCRKHLVKEELDNVKYTRIQLKILYVLDISCKLLFSYGIFKFIWNMIQKLI